MSFNIENLSLRLNSKDVKDYGTFSVKLAIPDKPAIPVKPAIEESKYQSVLKNLINCIKELKEQEKQLNKGELYRSERLEILTSVIANQEIIQGSKNNMTQYEQSERTDELQRKTEELLVLMESVKALAKRSL